ncbi:MAG: hypothetical protein AAFV43_01035 [Planctomycetota bacterium]
MRCSPSRQSNHRGLGLLEIVGCLVAMAVGVWIGAQYLGVDLNGAAYQALDETELLTQLPEDWRPVNPECPDGDCPSDEEKWALESAVLLQERDTLRFEVAKLRAPDLASVGADALSQDTLLDAEKQRLRTQTTAYWQNLHDIVAELDDIDLRTEPLLGSDDHSRVLSIRRRAYDYSARAVEHLETNGVDTRAVEMGVRVAEWCREGAHMFAKAAELAGSQPVGGRSVRAEQLWVQSRTELEKLTDMVRRKAVETLVYLNGQYFVELNELPL